MTVQREVAVNSGETGNWGRKFALVEACGSRLEKEFEEKVEQLLHGSDQWEVAHPDVCTAENEVLIFRLLMRARAAFFQLLTFPHSGFPYCLFKLLEIQRLLVICWFPLHVFMTHIPRVS